MKKIDYRQLLQSIYSKPKEISVFAGVKYADSFILKNKKKAFYIKSEPDGIHVLLSFSDSKILKYNAEGKCIRPKMYARNYDIENKI